MSASVPRLLVVGGGAAGLGAAAKLARHAKVTVLEPSETHFYQPGFTLVAAGLYGAEAVRKAEGPLIPQHVKWHRAAAERFEPEKSCVVASDGQVLNYDALVVATGIRLNLTAVPGLQEALADDASRVCTIYNWAGAQKTYRLIRAHTGGQAIFTFPDAPIKCAGAPQKIAYLADDLWRESGVRATTKMEYRTALPRIFGIEKYANRLLKIAAEKEIELKTRQVLVAVDGRKRVATFKNLDTQATSDIEFDFLHVGPPCAPVPSVAQCSELSDAAGFVTVNGKTLQHTRYPNVFALGDAAATPNAKTAAAISGQLGVLEKNVRSFLEKRPLTSEYDGYASCPLVVARDKVLLAEFCPTGPLETFPFDQAEPRRIFYWLKRYAMPALYWNALIRGRWNGPTTMRKILHLGMSK